MISPKNYVMIIFYHLMTIGDHVITGAGGGTSTSMKLKLLLARMASELEKSGVELLDGVGLKGLRLVKLRLCLLPHPLCVGELLLRQLHQPLRLPPRLLRVTLLRHCRLQLLPRLFLYHSRCRRLLRVAIIVGIRSISSSAALPRRVLFAEIRRPY